MAPSARPVLIAGNWKINLDQDQGAELIRGMSSAWSGGWPDGVEVAVLPPFTAIADVRRAIAQHGLAVQVGAQDMSPEAGGAFTGDVSGMQLVALGCTYVLVGHSERRNFHSERDEQLAAKVTSALGAGLVPVLCVGEGLDVRNAGNQVNHAVHQLRSAMAHVAPNAARDLVIAYEPVWAIGTGRVATSDDAQEVCGALRHTMSKMFDTSVAARIRILYGGSVKAANVSEILAQPDVDGALVGGASLDAAEFTALAMNSGDKT